jgi:hypothetical protein
MQRIRGTQIPVHPIRDGKVGTQKEAAGRGVDDRRQGFC